MASGSSGGATPRTTAGRDWLRDLGFVLVLLAALGAATWHLFRGQTPDPWVGFAILALLVFLMLTRGRGLSEFTIGKEGVTAKLEEVAARAAEAGELAGRAKLAADQAAAQSAQAMVEAATATVTSTPAVDGAAGAAPAAAAVTAPAAERVVGPAPADDPQKNQWGGAPLRNHRRLSAKIIPRPGPADTFDVHLRVEPVETGPPLAGPVRFHLHPTFVPDMRRVAPEEDVAHLHLIAWGAFTVGAEVEGEPKTFLELDLAELPDAPPMFRSR